MDVFTCYILECPLIPTHVVLVVKHFKDSDKHKRKTDALQEMHMGGLNYKEIIGALGIFIKDAFKLFYDHNNNEDLRSFVDKCDI